MASITYEQRQALRRDIIVRAVRATTATLPESGTGDMALIDGHDAFGNLVESYQPEWQSFPQPLNPDIYGFGILWAEQYDGDNIIVVRYDDLNANEYIRVEAVGPRETKEYGTVQTDFYHATIRVRLPGKLASFGEERSTEVSVMGGGSSDPRKVAIAARALTIAAHIAEQWDSVIEELS